MAKIEGVKAVIAQLRKLAQAVKDVKTSVIVGYTQNYALFVHENMTAHHPVGQSKYLEAAIRMHQKEIAKIVQQTYIRTKNMEKSLLMGGFFLQRKSQELVPVDTGALKGSAFTRVDK